MRVRMKSDRVEVERWEKREKTPCKTPGVGVSYFYSRFQEQSLDTPPMDQSVTWNIGMVSSK